MKMAKEKYKVEINKLFFTGVDKYETLKTFDSKEEADTFADKQELDLLVSVTRVH